MTFRSERQLLDPVSAFLARQRFPIQDAEIPFYESRIDLYGYSEDQHLTLAVELKLKNWQRALKQALLYQLCSDLTYIAMPLAATRNVDRELLAAQGIGLIGVGDSGRCRVLVPAELSPETRSHYKEAYVAFLKGRSG